MVTLKTDYSNGDIFYADGTLDAGISGTNIENTATNLNTSTRENTLDPNFFIPYFLKQHIISYYKFDEAAGVAAVDSIGSFDLTHTNVTVNQTGILNKCGYYNGTTSVTDADDTSTHSYGTGTISLWFKSDDVVGTQYLVSKVAGDAGRWLHRLYLNTATLTFSMFSLNGNAETVTAATAVTATDWHHVVVSWQFPGFMHIYMDGVLEGFITTTDKCYYPTNTEVALSIGGDFAGYIDELAYFATSLGPKAVEWLYNSGSALALE